MKRSNEQVADKAENIPKKLAVQFKAPAVGAKKRITAAEANLATPNNPFDFVTTKTTLKKAPTHLAKQPARKTAIPTPPAKSLPKQTVIQPLSKSSVPSPTNPTQLFKKTEPKIQVKIEPNIPEFQNKLVPTPELVTLINKHTSPPNSALNSITPAQPTPSPVIPSPTILAQTTPNPAVKPTIPIAPQPPSLETFPVKNATIPANLKPFHVLDKNQLVPKSLLLVDKYSPKTLAEIIGNPKAVAELRQWLLNFKAKKPGTEPAILLTGPPGIGKTTVAHVLFKEYNYRVTELNASEDRTRGAVIDRMLPLMMNNSSTLFKCTGNALVLDEIDGMTGEQGGIGAVISLLKGEFSKLKPENSSGNKKAAMTSLKTFKTTLVAKPEPSKKVGKTKAAGPPVVTSTPVICIANQSYSKKLGSLKSICKEIKFSTPTQLQQRELIARVLTGENFTFGPMVTLCLAQKINTADFRHILVELDQFLRDHLRTHNGQRHISDEQASELVVSQVDHDSQSPFAAAIRLLKGGLNLEQSYITLSVDAGLLPTMLAQNYLEFLPSAAKQNRTAKQIAQAEAEINIRMFDQAQLYSDCDLFPSYSHNMQLILGFGTSVLSGKANPANTIRQSAQTLAPLAFPEYAVVRAQQSCKKLPLGLRLSTPPLDMSLVRFRLPTAVFWGKDKTAQQRIHDLLAWTKRYQLEFSDVSSLNSLTQLGKIGTNPNSTPVVFGGKGKKGLQALMRLVQENNDLTEADLNSALDSYDEDDAVEANRFSLET